MLIITLTMDVARALRAEVVDYEGQRPMEMVEVVIVIIVIVVTGHVGGKHGGCGYDDGQNLDCD